MSEYERDVLRCLRGIAEGDDCAEFYGWVGGDARVVERALREAQGALREARAARIKTLTAYYCLAASVAANVILMLALVVAGVN